MTIRDSNTLPSDLDRFNLDGLRPHERISTGIGELDGMLHGGFLVGDAVLIAGSAGTGKTTLGLQYIVNGVSSGDPGVYVTFEQLPDQIYRDARNFGWNLRKLEEENKLRVICTSPDIILESEGENLLDEATRDIHPRRIVIDSLSHLEMFVQKRHLRMEAYRLISYLKARRMSSLLMWESPQISGSSFTITDAGLSFLVDCILVIKPVEIESSLRKALVIVKMRGSDHDKQLREFEITSKGISVSGPFSDFEGVITGTPRRSVTQKAISEWSRAFSKKQKHD